MAVLIKKIVLAGWGARSAGLSDQSHPVLSTNCKFNICNARQLRLARIQRLWRDSLPQHSAHGSTGFVSTLVAPLSQECIRAAEIVRQYGRTSIDALKLWPPKRYFFSPSRCSVIAYGVENGTAVALGDPVGPEREFEGIVREFLLLCKSQGLVPAFYRTCPDFLPIYRQQEFKKLKIGEDAVVELSRFSLTGKSKRDVRSKARRFDAQGVKVIKYEPPLSSAVLAQLRQVSDEWLQLPGRRERSFAVGYFDSDYLRSTPVLAAIDIDGKVQAFMNLVYESNEMTGDLMRRRKDAPNGIMDYLFLSFLRHAKDQEYSRVSLGLAPMTGFRAGEFPSMEERLIHALFDKLGFLFSFQGLHDFKAKFATSWEPRFLLYQRTLQLPRIGLALHALAKVGRATQSEGLGDESIVYGSQ